MWTPASVADVRQAIDPGTDATGYTEARSQAVQQYSLTLSALVCSPPRGKTDGDDTRSEAPLWQPGEADIRRPTSAIAGTQMSK